MREWLWFVWISLFPVHFGLSFERDLEHALKGSSLSGVEFHRKVLTVMSRHGKIAGQYCGATGYMKRTVGDDRSRLLWVNSGGFAMDDLYLICKERTEVKVRALNRPKGEDWQVFQAGVLRHRKLVFCDSAYAGGNWSMPCVRVYEKRGNEWELKQNLYAGGKEARTDIRFRRRSGKVDITQADGEVRVYPVHLAAPHVGPLLTYKIRFELIGGVYKQTLYKRVETPLAALDDLAAMRVRRNREGFDHKVPKTIANRLWSALANSDDLYVSTNSNVVEDQSPILRVAGWQITFRKTGNRWKPHSVHRYTKDHG
ncbi:MAG TPA: hypothetical protein PKA27_06185 [Fimbriimonadaceae bacterium]|nr:hypothetical protein [Fimbriimonadaceae bacterium]